MGVVIRSRRGAANATSNRLPAIVPAYFHPATNPREWELMALHPEMLRLVVLNIANGPGDRREGVFLGPLIRLRAAGVRVAGYVDTNYGGRPTEDALVEIGHYLDWYGVTGVLFDRVSADSAQIRRYLSLVRCARALGVDMVAFNHGTHPVEAYADHADLLGTFEGTWRSYLDLAVPRWVRARPTEQFYHLVHSVPDGRSVDAYSLAARRHVGAFYATERGGVNPWDGLPSCYQLDDWEGRP